VSLARAGYRARQFFHALFPRFEDHHLEHVRAILDEGEFALFESMEKRDQRHGVRVMEHLRAEHHADRDLLAAALLHDCGKGDMPVWLRIANVVFPAYLQRLATKAQEGHSGRGHPAAAFRLVHHARLGAGLAEKAGSSAATVRYISGSAAEHEHDRIAVLRAADDRS